MNHFVISVLNCTLMSFGKNPVQYALHLGLVSTGPVLLLGSPSPALFFALTRNSYSVFFFRSLAARGGTNCYSQNGDLSKGNYRTMKRHATCEAGVPGRNALVERLPLVGALLATLDHVACDLVAAIAARLRPRQRHRVGVDVLDHRLPGRVGRVCGTATSLSEFVGQMSSSHKGNKHCASN